MDFITAQNRAQDLTKQLEYHNNLYYNQDDPEISDYDYDMLMRELENIEKEFPSLKSPMSVVMQEKSFLQLLMRL
mgnify:CR=1 FL=1